MIGKYLVIAGNHGEFNTFIKKKAMELWAPDYNISLSDFLYVAVPDQLRGYSNPKGFFIGSWCERNDMEEILYSLSIRMTDPSKLQTIRDIYSKWRAYCGG